MGSTTRWRIRAETATRTETETTTETKTGTENETAIETVIGTAAEETVIETGIEIVIEGNQAAAGELNEIVASVATTGNQMADAESDPSRGPALGRDVGLLLRNIGLVGLAQALARGQDLDLALAVGTANLVTLSLDLWEDL